MNNRPRAYQIAKSIINERFALVERKVSSLYIIAIGSDSSLKAQLILFHFFFLNLFLGVWGYFGVRGMEIDRIEVD